MRKFGKIITVGLSPAWDVKCIGNQINWGSHSIADSMTITPAGKALNVSKALAELKIPSTAAGLWGTEDIENLYATVKSYKKYLKLSMTTVQGRTRSNFWILNPKLKKEMHIRNKSTLENKSSLAKLKKQLLPQISNNDIVVFSGAMSLDAIGLVKSAASITPYIVADTSDQILTKLLKSKKLWLIKPNFQEFCHLINKKIPNTPKIIFTQAQNLLKYCPNILITRGSKGAVFINQDFQIIQDLPKTQLAQATVGCGDYSLAGFLAGLFKGKPPLECLDLAVRTSVKRAHSKS